MVYSNLEVIIKTGAQNIRSLSKKYYDIEQFFDIFLNNSAITPVLKNSQDTIISPRINVAEKDDECYIDADLAVLNQSNIEVRVEGILPIQGKKEDYS